MIADYTELLRKSSEKFNSIVCMGMDPVLDDIPLKNGSPHDIIFSFYEALLNAIVRKSIYPAAVKPNYAFYAQYGFGGLQALEELIRLYRGAGLPVILDVKRGDIGSTAEAYSRECFGFFNADAVTLSPFLGADSITPFTKNYPDRGCYILNKTSNKSSGEIQDIMVDGTPLFIHISRKIIEWHRPGMGAVVGATYPEQLARISDIFIGSGKDVPLLIPGIGSQGGSAKEVCGILSRYPDIRIHRINSSSAINYAYKKFPSVKFDDAAVHALDELNGEINGYF